MADFRQRHAGRHERVVYLQLLEHLLDEGDLVGRVVDDEVARQTDCGGLATQQPGTQCMERGNPGADKRSAQQSFHAGAHFSGGLVGEGDGENLVLLRESLGEEIGDALRDDARLARSRAGEDQQRAVNMEHRLALFGSDR